MVLYYSWFVYAALHQGKFDKSELLTYISVSL